MVADRLKITPEEFLEYTPQELAGVLFYSNKEKDNLFKAEWERTRLQTYHLIAIQVDKKHNFTYEKFKEKYWPFYWEKKDKKIITNEKLMTPEEWAPYFK